MIYRTQTITLKNGTVAILRAPAAGDGEALIELLKITTGETDFLSGYPEEITMTAEAAGATYVAGGALKDGKLVTSGGRVTGTTAIAGSLEEAIKEAYRLSDGVKFEGAYRRSDIGQRALQAGK